MPSHPAEDRIRAGQVANKEARLNRWIPAELSFEEVIKNNTSTPCSLNDFMDYMVHVEQNAENLQFFLWFCDYVQRWARLCPKQKALSKPWSYNNDTSKTVPVVTTEITAGFPKSQRHSIGHRRQTSQKLETILHILEEECERERERKQPIETISEAPFSPVTSERRNHTRAPSYSRPSQPFGSEESLYGNMLTFTIQPFRDEISRVVRHYIAPLSTSTPRPLFLLTPEARTDVHKASQQTTHPSAVLPALEVAETVVRASHPNFIRWAVRNANDPRLYFWSILGAISVLLGVIIMVLCSTLVNSIAGMTWLWLIRTVVASLFWWPGTFFSVAAWRGICIVRFMRGMRDVRPWELGETGPPPPSPTTWLYSGGGKSIDDDVSDSVDLELGLGWRKHVRKTTSMSTISVAKIGSSMDPLRKATMQTFGPANDYEKDLGCWKGMGLWRRINAPEVAVPKDCKTRKLQKRIVVVAGIWSAAVTAGLVVGSAFLPRPS